MRFEVGVIAHFTARHHLVGDFGPAGEPHAHAYKVEVTVVGEGLRVDGTLFDITRLQVALAGVIEMLDGRDLNELPQLAAPNPTAEVVARFFFDRLRPALDTPGLVRLQTRVWESPDAYAGYSGELA